MTRADDEQNGEGGARRVDIELFIRHPSLTPQEITAALGLEARFAHGAGGRRKAPDGTLLDGVYRDTRWRHSIRHELRDQWFADKVAALVDRLVPHRDFLHSLRDTGGAASIMVQFLGDGYLGDELSADTLAKMADLRLDLGLEVYDVPQS